MTKAYHNGPIPDEERKKTDVVCLILFIVFNIVMLGIAIYSWTNGNFSKLTTPYDPDGKGCGVDYPDYPYIYFASPHSDSLWVTTCVKKCPTQKDTVLDCKVNSVVTSCTPNNNADNTKAVQIYDSYPVRNTICIPSSSKIKSQITAAFGAQTLQDKVSSLSNSWVIILIAIPLAIVLAVIFMLIMRFTAGFFVYILLLASIISLIALGIYLLAAPADSYIAQSRYLSIIIGVVSIILGIAIALMFICFRKRIELASSIVKVSTRFVNQNCPVMLLQAILFVMMIAFAILWILQALGFYSLGTPITPAAGQHLYPFQHFDTTWKIKALGLVHVFYLFWGMVFLVQTGDFIVAGTVTSWYFKRETPYKESTKRYLSFHIGSVCFGSFLLALIGFIKFVYQLLTPQQDNKEGCLGAWKKFCNCCCYVCITWLFDCLNNGAYTFIHLAGQTYCTSAFEVIAIKVKDLVITGVVAVLSILFSVLIRVGLTALVCLLCYVIVKNVQPYKTQVVDSTLTMVIVGLIAFTISSFFVSLYANAMDSISVCYLIDKDAGGGQDKCPDELKQFLEQAKKEGHNID